MSLNKVSKILISAIIFIAPCVSMADCCCRKIVDYIVVNEMDSYRIIDKVKKLIVEGWMPLGNAEAHLYGLYQTMVKYEIVEGWQCER